MSLLKDIQTHLLADAAIAAVTTRAFGTQVPDQQALPYLRLERTEQETRRTSKDSIVSSTVVVTSYAATAAGAESLAALVDARMQTMFASTSPASTLDVKPEDDAIEAEPERGKEGVFRYAAPVTYTVLRQVPRAS